MRAILIDWLVDISVKFQLDDKTFYICIDIIDRVIRKMQIKRSEF